MKHTTLGVLGLGSRSTSFYIEELHRQYHRIHQGYSTCPFTLLSIDFNEINPYLPDQFEQLETNLLPYLKAFEISKVKEVIVPNITLHETIDRLRLQHHFSYQIIHPLELVLRKLKKDKAEKVIIIGSMYTMNASYLKDVFSTNEVDVLSISEESKKQIDVVRVMVYQGTLTPKQQTDFQHLLEQLSKLGKIVVACTELSLIMKKMNVDGYDMALCQIEAAVEIVNKNSTL